MELDVGGQKSCAGSPVCFTSLWLGSRAPPKGKGTPFLRLRRVDAKEALRQEER